MKSKWPIILILVLAGGLRLYKLASFPVGLNADEAALGYNAYSLLLTGRDEHGHPWPVNLESFGDFKPAAYAYILIPFIKLGGLTELMVRLPSALAGIIGVGVLYLLVKEITKDAKWALLAALVLTISPWHIHFSRGAWETNVANTFILLGVWQLAIWLRTSKINPLLGGIFSLVLSMYTYQSARVIAPLLGLGFAILYFRKFVQYPKQIVLAIVLLFILLTPLTSSLIITDASSRSAGVGLLADEGPVNRANELRGQYRNPGLVLARVLHNRWVGYFILFLQNYSDHFQGNFLFVNGDMIARNKVPETGLLYLTDVVLVVAGGLYLLRKRDMDTRLIWWWLAIAPAAAGLTFQTPQAVRSSNLVIPLTILVSLGAYEVLKHWKLFGICVLGFVYLWQVTRYLHEYYVHYPQVYPQAWEYGFKQLVPDIESMKNRYDQVWVTDKYDQPYILFLLYSKYSPAQFQNHHQLTFRDKFNFSTVRDYDKYHFAATPWDTVRDMHPTLIVAAPEDIPDVGVNIVKTIYFPNGQPAFKIVSN